MVSKYHLDQHQKELKAEKDEAQRLHRIAASLGKMVKEFWSNVEKVCLLYYRQVVSVHQNIRLFGCFQEFLAS